MKRDVTGSVQKKRTAKGREYWYTVIKIKDLPPKWEATGLITKGNKKEAERILDMRIRNYEKELEEEEHKKQKIDKKSDAQLHGENTLLSDYIREFIENYEGVRKSTAEGYEYKARHIIDYFSDKNITVAGLTASDVNVFVKYLLKDGKVNTKTGERSGLAIITVRTIKNILVSAMKQAVVLGYRKDNPALNVTVSNKKNSELARKFYYLEIDELNRLFEFMEQKNDSLSDVVKVITYFGLRRSEALGITLGRNSLDLENRKLRISRTVVKVKELHDEEDTKTVGSQREFSITDEMYSFFKKVMDKKEEDKAFYGKQYYNSDYVFTWEDGRPFSPDYLTKHFEKLMKEYGKPETTLHNMRASCANFLYETGWGEWEISDYLGHSDPSVSKKWYIALKKQNNRKKMDSLNGVLKIN